jgi:Ca-activated chloride channel family protein
VRLFNDLPVSTIEGGFMAELGDLTSGESRRLLLEIDVPQIGELGLAQVAELELRWVEVDTMKSKVAKLPVNVNVVPGDQAAGRVADAEVETELAFQRAQRTKREATDALRDGDGERAAGMYKAASADLLTASHREDLPAPMAEELSAEASVLDDLAARAELDDSTAPKMARADYHMKARKRGRGRRRE